MALNLIMTSQREELKPRITVFGVGGAGGNAVNNMIDKNLEGVEFVVANTDAQALQQSRAVSKIQMGLKVTEGLGAGARPTVGAAAAEETIEEIVDHLAGAHMCFITAGMGGGTGTGAAPIIAQAARELGVLTVGVVTKPFQFEGNKRMKQAEEGITALQKVVDTLIIIPNQNLFRLANERTTFTDAFAMADDVLYQGVKGVTDLMVRPGLINLDFADVRAVMDEMGKAMMGTGEATGDNRAVEAAEKAIANPLLDEISLHGAKGVLINITGGYDLTLFELDEAANIIREKVDPDANIIVGSTLDTSMEGTLRVSVVATGIDVGQSRAEQPATRRSMAEPLKPAPEPKLTVSPVATPVAAAPQAPAKDLFQTQPAYQQPTYQQPEAELAMDDDLPPPVYRPAPQQPQMQQAPVQQGFAQQPRAQAPLSLDADAGSFVAPRPRAAGTPSPEALARLQAAVSKSPAQQAAAARQPVQQQPQRAAAPAAKPAERPRFGIGSLINRMAGGHAEAAQDRPQAGRQQPPVTAYDDEQELSADQERIEIPAFLRRQAN
ncbi:MAG: cell division protein FtsZ [Rhodobacteraceae bacterium]|uniref:cell division protein FtsZ n=1 Tax=Cypionkella sp. TaxID=2811411 RepID=UPI001327E981|nr:cell division protein FtsZ [Cypionkella sp.]KAF0173439.1 MAG: cell division protein FtsZ [Paracoccaceae bacterium]MDO8326707.1 cell division protein FtsZ [Cypionkella sp.]